MLIKILDITDACDFSNGWCKDNEESYVLCEIKPCDDFRDKSHIKISIDVVLVHKPIFLLGRFNYPSLLIAEGEEITKEDLSQRVCFSAFNLR